MNVLDLSAYNAALGQDAIKIGDTSYPLQTLTFRQAIAFSGETDQVDFSDAAAAAAFVARFAEVSGIPVAALEPLSFSAILAAVRFFSGCQLQLKAAAYDQAISSSLAGATT